MVMDEKHGDGHSTFLLEVGTTHSLCVPSFVFFRRGGNFSTIEGVGINNNMNDT